MTAWKFFLLDINHVMINDVPVIRMFGVTDTGKSIVVFDDSAKPYFYVEPKPGLPKQDMAALKDRIFSLEVEGRSPDMAEDMTMKILGKETPLVKVAASNPSDIGALRDLVKDREDVREEYEYTIPFYRRYLIDHGIKPTRWLQAEGRKYNSSLAAEISVKADRVRELEDFSQAALKVMAFGIETAEESGEKAIVMLSIKDNRGFQRVVSTKKVPLRDAEKVANERDILLRFMHIVRERNPDVLVGYNSDDFDMAALEQKAAKHGLSLVLGRDSAPVAFRMRGRIHAAYMTGRVHLDLYGFIDHILSANMASETLTLDMVSRELLGEEKKDMPPKEMQRIWSAGSDLESMALHCLRDSELTLKLAGRVMPLIFQFSRLTGITPFDCCRATYSQLVEGLMMRKAHERGEVILNRPRYEEVRARRMAEPYEGGYVKTPEKGMHENIALFDFRSLYPSITVTFNISPETLDCGHPSCQSNRPPEGEHNFCLKEKGMIPSILEELIEKRADIKRRMGALDGQSRADLKNRQYALKILSNAFYGYLGYPSSRWYSRVCAKAVASYGRHYIRQVLSMAEAGGFNVIYGDTDSLFVKMKTKREAREFLKKANKELPGIMEMEFHGMYKRGLFMETQAGVGAKKKYALLDERGNIVMRGLEARRRDWSAIAKDTQERVLLAVLRENSPQTALDIVAETVRRLKQEKVDMHDLIIYTQLTKPTGSYEQVGPHVAVAKKLEQRGETVKEGTTIAYIVTKGQGSISERSEPAETAKDYDPDYYIHNQVAPSALRVLSALGITREELMQAEDQSSLSGFFRRQRTRQAPK